MGGRALLTLLAAVAIYSAALTLLALLVGELAHAGLLLGPVVRASTRRSI